MAWTTEATMTANQVVAYNLARARRLRGLTQQEAGERIARYLGEAWRKASWSAAERSVTGERIREFDADEILAFARLFDLPVAWFFLPPAEPTSLGVEEGVRGGGTGEALALDGLLRLATRLNSPDMLERLRELLPETDPAAYVAAHVPAISQGDVEELRRLESQLRGLADELGARLGDLREQVMETVATYQPHQAQQEDRGGEDA